MSYLSQPTSELNYGVVKVGANVHVTDGIISIAQSLDPNATVTFDSVYVTGNLVFNGSQVVTDVTPSAGAGISLSSVTTGGPHAAFTVNNTGVVTVAGSVGLNVSSSTGNVTLTNTGVTKVTGNVGIAVDNNTGNVVVTNTGVTKLIAGGGISLSSQTGNITISSTGADLIHVYGTTTNYTATYDDEYIGFNSTVNVTLTLPAGIDGRVYYIKDEHGQGSGKITVQPQPGEKIDGGTNYVISVPYQGISVVFRAGGWWII